MSGPSPGGQQPGLLTSAALACGAEVDLLLEQVADGRGADLDAHQRQCVHCQAAIAEFTAIWEPVAELASTPLPAPTGLTAAVMSHIRVLARDVWYTLQTTDLGAIRVAARIVAAHDIQRQVIASLRDHLGLKTIAVNVTVDDILTDDDISN